MPWYGLFIDRQFDGTKTDVLTGTMQYSLHTTSETPDQDVDNFFDDVSATETSGTNYTANGITLASKTSVYDTGTDEWRFDATDPAWTNVTIAWRYGIVWENTGGASTTDPLAFYHDHSSQSVTAANVTVQFDATGAAKIDVT